VWRAVRRLDPDFVIATGADDWLWTSLTPLPAGISLVLVRHMSLPLPALLRRLAGHRARAIVTVAESVRKIMLDGSVLTPQRVVTIYNPVRFAVRNELPTREEKELARRSLNLPVGPALLLFCGGLNPGKGLADAARAATVASRSRDILLVVCGPSADDGDPAAALERLTQEGAGRTDRLQIRNLGRVENMKDLLTSTDVLLLPTHSNLGEGMPLIVAEAMALGAPIVAYAVGGVSEALVADRDCGRLIETDNVEAFVGATIETLQDRSQAEAMALRASKRAKSLFDPQASADSWERLLNSLAARGR
jgi:glycosyltransferase involved in cell wall biosynthesis